jgi:hypothetical protein
LVSRKGVHALMMKYRNERYRRRCRFSIGYVLIGKRFGFCLLSQPVIALADFSQGTDVVIGEFSIHDQTAKRVALPCRAIC